MDRRASTGRRINISPQQSASQDNIHLWDFVHAGHRRSTRRSTRQRQDKGVKASNRIRYLPCQASEQQLVTKPTIGIAVTPFQHRAERQIMRSSNLTYRSAALLVSMLVPACGNSNHPSNGGSGGSSGASGGNTGALGSGGAAGNPGKAGRATSAQWVVGAVAFGRHGTRIWPCSYRSVWFLRIWSLEARHA